MGERIDVEAGGQRVKGKVQKGERNQKDGEKTAGWREKRSTGEEEKDDVWGRGRRGKRTGEKRRRGRKLGSDGTHAAIFRPTTSSGAGLQIRQLPEQR